MKDWKASLLLKIIAVALFAVFLAVAGLSLIGIFFGYDMGVYQGVTDPMETDFARAAAVNFAYGQIIHPYVEDGETLEDLIAYSSGDNCNFVFSLYETEEDGREVLLASTLDAVSERRVLRDDLTWEGVLELGPESEPCEDTGSDSPPEWDYGIADDTDSAGAAKTLRLRLVAAVKENLPNRFDGLYFGCQLFQWISQYKNELIFALVLSVLLGIADFILLCCMAGHRKSQEGIVCNWADRIPFDLYAGVAVIAISVLLVFAFDVCFGREIFSFVLGCLCVLFAAMLALAAVLSLATRIKAGHWWRNTVIYRVLRWVLRVLQRCRRLALRIFRAIPLVWRSGLITTGLLFVLFFFGYGAYWEFFFGFLYFLLSLVILSAVVLGAYELRLLQRGGEALAAGKFESKVDTAHMFWDFKRHGENLNAIGIGMGIAVEERMKSERLKTELITNVSHDIKTPLTSIINYVDLLQKPHTEEEETQYLEVLARQSARLKKLTEDLVEASKASTGNMEVSLLPTNVAETLDQALAEYQDRMAAGAFQIVTVYPDRETAILADGRLLWRVLDNLLNNVCKYALPGTRVYVTFERAVRVRISIKNISRQALNVSADELMERFVRGDTARSTEGSGLGLNIAKSLTELQGGTLQLTVDGDLFKAELEFPLVVG